MELHEVCCEFISNNIILFQHIKSCKKFLKQYGHFHVTNQPYFEGNFTSYAYAEMNVEKLNLKQNYAYNSITKHMIGFGIKLTCAYIINSLFARIALSNGQNSKNAKRSTGGHATHASWANSSLPVKARPSSHLQPEHK